MLARGPRSRAGVQRALQRGAAAARRTPREHARGLQLRRAAAAALLAVELEVVVGLELVLLVLDVSSSPAISGSPPGW